MTFNGNCEAAFDFYKSVFGGEFDYKSKFKDMPRQEGLPPILGDDLEKIMHVSLPISKETVLMGSDTAGEWATQFVAGNNFSISINAESKSEADYLFNRLSEGGSIMMPMSPTFWSSYFGMLTDKFGINWMLGFDENLHQ